ncbi:MAG: tandem-95 repeat protein [Chryseolinea sp.]
MVLPCALFAQPVANDDAVSVAEDVGGVYNLVTNDSDATFAIDPATVDLDVSTPLTLEQTITTVAGNFSVDATGVLTVVLAANYNGTTTLQYTVKNNVPLVPETSLPADVSVTVSPVNDAPVVSIITDQSIAEDTNTGALAFTVSDIETSAASLTVTVVSSTPGLIDAGGLLVSGTGTSRSLTATPSANQTGSATITVSVDDGDASSDSQFVLTVLSADDDPPVISAVPAISTGEDVTSAPVAFTVSDPDTPLNTLTVTAVSDNPALIPNANVTVVQVSPGSWTVVVIPVADQFGPANIALTVSDLSGSDQTNASVTVSSVNDLPTISTVTDKTIPENTAAPSFDVSLTDIETAVSALAITASSSNLTLLPVANIVESGTGATRSFVITPAVNQSGTAIITLQVNDGNGGTDDVVFQLTVTAVNNDPTIAAISDQAIGEDVAGGTGPISFIIGDENPATVVLSGTSSNATLVPVANIVFTGSGVSRNVQVTPASNGFGTATITITATDASSATDTETFVVTVNAVNDNPTVSSISNQSLAESTSSGPLAFTIDDIETAENLLTITASSSDLTLVPLSGIVLGGSGAARNVNITPAAGESGSSTITLTVSDGTGSVLTTFVVSVNASDDAPTITAISDQTINEDNATNALAFTIGDSDTPLGSLTLSATSSNQTIVPNANIIFGGSGASRTVTVNPAPEQSGAILITITLSDLSLSVIEAFTLTVNAVNDNPTISSIPDQSLGEGVSSGPLAFIIDDIETAENLLTITVASSNTALVPLAGIVQGGSGANRNVNIAPTAGQSGSSIITVTVGDGTGSNQTTFVVSVNALDDPPTITAISNQTIDEDEATNALAFTIGDIDTPVGSLTLVATSSDQTLVPNANIIFGGAGASRTVTINPAPEQSGSALITITLSDQVQSVTETFTLTVQTVNDLPAVSAVANQSTNEDSASGSIAFTISDAETAASALVVAATSSNTALVPNSGIVLSGSGASRSIGLTPAPNQFGTTTVTLSVTDASAGSSQITFVLTVNSMNDLPTITPIAAQNIAENSQTGPLSFSIADLETPVASLVLTRMSSNVALVDNTGMIVAGGGSMRNINVIPKLNQSGSTTITLNVFDGSQSVETAFLVNVSSFDDPPVISSIPDINTNEDTQSALVPFTVSDPETPAGSLTVTGVSDNVALIPDANILLNEVSAGNWTIRVVPIANASGTATLTVTVSDGIESTNITVGVTVNAINDLPTITTVSNQATTEDTPLATLNLTINDVETAAGALIITATSSNATLVPIANIVEGGSGGLRTIDITPAANQSGTSTITLRVTDENTGSRQTTFTLTVTSVNDNPTITTISDQTIDEDTPGGTGLIPFTVDDAEAGALTVTRATSNPGLAPLINVVLGGSGTSRTVRVTPLANQSGTATITITVTDGGSASATQSFNVIVNSVNDNPTISSIANQAIDEGTSSGSLAFTVGDVETGANLLQVTSASDNTTLVPLSGIVLGGSGTNRNVTITPAAGESGTATITLTVDDGTITSQTSFTVTVTGVDNAPTISAIADQTVNEDIATSALAFTVADSDSDVNTLVITTSSSDPVVIPNGSVVIGGSGASRTVAITPGANQTGSATITITVSDGSLSATETLTVTVQPVNDTPTITAIANQSTNEDVATGVIAFTIGDVETDPSLLVVTGLSNNTTLVPTADIAFSGSGTSRTVLVTPAANESGTVTISVRVNDGTVTATRNFQVVVTAVNDAPSISAISAQTITEDSPTGPINFTIGDVETAAGLLTLTRSSSNTTLVPIANVVLGGSGSARTVSITPANNQTGTSLISITVDDGTTTTTLDFDLTVTGVDDAPTISAISNRTTNEDVSTGDISFTINDPEKASSDLTVSATSDNLTLIPAANVVLGGVNNTRTINITPALNQTGSAVITLVVSDGLNSTPWSFTVNVTPVNDLPQITGQQAISINEAQPVSLSLSQLTVFDPDNIPSELTLFVTGGTNYAITGLSTITPAPAFSGTLSVNVLIGDGSGFNPGVVTVTVLSTNDVPVITSADPLTVNEDQVLSLALDNFNVTDADSNYPADFTLSVLSGTNYTFSGTTITPTPNYNGAISVNVKVNDGSVDSAPFAAIVTVNPVNDPPVITGQAALTTNEETPVTLTSGSFTITDPEPTSYTLTVLPAAANAPYTVSGNAITPKTDVTGNITVQVTVNDGTVDSAPFDAVVNVLPVNDPPTITGQGPISIVEDTPIAIALSDLIVTDVDNTFPTGFSLTVLPGTDYTFSGTTITPSLDFVGVLKVNVSVSDGSASSASYALNVTITDDADIPVITGQNAVTMPEDQSREITKADVIVEDPDTPDAGRILTVLPGTNYTENGNTITPSPNFFGTLTVNVRIFDGEANSNTFPLQVTVQPVNDSPSFNAISNVTVTEDAAQQTITITGIAAGPLESQTLSLSYVSDNTALLPSSTTALTYNSPATTATFVFKPQADAYGVATITVKLLDFDANAIEVVGTFTINVTSVNDAPRFAPITIPEMSEDGPEQIITITGISPGGGALESGQLLTFIESLDNPLLEIFEVTEYVQGQSTVTLRIKPLPNASGTTNLTIRLQDNGTSSPPPNTNFFTRTYPLVIQAVNDLPLFVSVPPETAEPGVPYVYNIEVSDPDTQTITITAPNIPSWMTLTQGANGKATLAGTPPIGTPGGAVTVELFANDPSDELVNGGYTISVNSKPVVSDFTLITIEDNILNLQSASFASGFTDGDGNSLAELLIIALPKNGQLKTSAGAAIKVNDKFSISEIETIVYEPLANYFGRDSIEWNGADGFLLYADEAANVFFTITPVNDAPVILAMEDEASDTLEYELGSEKEERLTRLFDAYDPDGDDIMGAQIDFKRLGDFKYRSLNDGLLFDKTNKISGTFDEAAGILTLNGRATATEYDSAIHSIRYQYVDALELLLDTRSVEITLSDGISESAPRSRIITLIYSFDDLNIPSAFSPNEGDNVNSTWEITYSGPDDVVKDAEIRVFNKRGLLLYKTTGLKSPWTGIYDGTLLPSDTYFYTIDLNYNRVQYKGTVTILR